ncbi:membrane-bound lytic murein transglycosylase MltF [Psychromonas ossibalaenae]|uniref:membrane-bound lytic murein transglycosylase MltF n=1 Tax=Psychromonas ossibalaenae TaxID=444922 RepID=UPI000381470E|nr:membrane-bound lytic murein transglycosylase MltF [Psychromonas ossibalaenae]
MPLKKLKQLTAWLFVSSALLLVGACNPFSQTSSLEKIQMRGDIIMGTINSSLTYSYDGSVYSGFDYELGKQFAAYLNVNFRIKEYNSLKELFDALDNNKIDFVGSGLTLTPKRSQKYRSSPPYYHVSQKVVYHKGTYRPRKIIDVNAPISVLKDSSHEETLDSMIDEVPDLEIQILENEDQETLLRKVADKEITFAIVDSSTLAQKQRYYPVLAEAFTISEKLPVAWLIKRDQDDSVYSAIIEFIGGKYQDQSIAKLEEKYFGHVQHFDFVDTRTFIKRIDKVLPKYEKLFKNYATAEVDWLLMAAVSYQESHWNPNAKSPTGVRGMMMLTLDTADYVGIENRLDAEQSIKGGAKYLSQLIKRLPDSIPNDEKVWFALASYNLGYGHLMDARRITAMKKQNPDAWSDVKENLPLLHQKKWYKKTRYGYARGQEAQTYVNNIRQYLKTLTWSVAEKEKAEAAAKALQDAKDKALAKEKALQEAKDKAAAEKIALQKALAEQQALEEENNKPLARKRALQRTEQDIELKEKAWRKARKDSEDKERNLHNAEKEILAMEKTLQEAQEKSLGAQQAFKLAQEQTMTREQALKFAQDEALAEQARLQYAKEKSLNRENILLKEANEAAAEQAAVLLAKEQAQAELNNYQTAKDKAFTALQASQKAKEDAQAERQKLKNAIELDVENEKENEK